MMASPPQSLDYWRGFFSGARATIFDTIAAAIRVAAADDPDGLRARRDAIAEVLFTALIVLPPSEAVVAPPTAAAPPLAHQENRQQLLPEGAGSVPSIYNSDGAARCDSDDPVVAEIFRIKAELSNSQQKSEDELVQLLRRLEQLEFTVHTIEITEIGVSVKPLVKKHYSKQIRQLGRSLIEGWKTIVDEWVSNGGAIVGPSCLEPQGGGLASPPMDEAGLSIKPCTYAQLSEFFDEMDDDGNIIIHAKEGEQHYPTYPESVKGQPPLVQRYDPIENWRVDQDRSTARQPLPHEPSRWQKSQQSIQEAKEKVSSVALRPGRPQRLQSKRKVFEMKPKQKSKDLSVAQGRSKPPKPTPPLMHDPNSVRSMVELAKKAKLEATKRKLQQGQQEFSDAKKQCAMHMGDPQGGLTKQGEERLHPSGSARNSNILISG